MALTKVSYSMIQGEAINAEDYGLSTSGSAANNTSALEAAFAAAQTSGATVVLASGKTYEFATGLTVPAGTKLNLNGGTLKVADGQYTVTTYPLPDNPSILLDGDDISIFNGTLDGNKANQTTLVNSSFSDTWIGHSAYAMIQGPTAYSNLVIQNCIIKDTIQTAIAIQGAWDNVTIQDNVFNSITDIAINQSNSGTTGATNLTIIGNLLQTIGTGLAGPSPTTQKGWSNAIVTTYNTSTIISNNTVKNVLDRDCIKLQIPNKTVVSSNVLFDASSGVQVQSASDAVESVIISDNSINTMRFSAIYIEASATAEDNITVSGNAIENVCTSNPASEYTGVPRMGIYAGLTKNISITGNTIKNIVYGTNGAITIATTENASVTGNTISDCVGAGVQLNYTNSLASVSCNNIVRPTSHGILIGNTVTPYGNNNYNTFSNNTIAYPGYGMGGTYYGIYMPQIGGSNNASFNMFANNLTIGRGNNIVSDVFIAYGNVGIGNYVNTYSGTGIQTSGNGYYDGTTGSATFVTAP